MEQPLANQNSLLLDRFFKLCEAAPEEKIFIFELEKEPSHSFTKKDFVNQIRISGSMLQQELAPQEKALLLFPQGLAYIHSLLACWYANVIAIPVQFTDLAEPEQVLDKIQVMLQDSEAKVIITTADLQDFLSTQQLSAAVRSINIDGLASHDAANCREVRTQTQSDLALILYTSGSIALPKEVALTHGNVLAPSRYRGELLGDQP
jgi:acyl-CoA synthetase (AMP-forming)/AMP-acid ligase II